MSREKRINARIVRHLEKARELLRKHYEKSETVGNIKSDILDAERRVRKLEPWRFER